MAQQWHLTVADQRPVTTCLRWLTLHAPELARTVRAGQYVLVRCADAESEERLLRRALYLAAAETALGQVGVLYGPDEPGLAWLARARPGDSLDISGPFGHPFELDRRTRNLLLLGQGGGLAALLLLARQATAHGCAVTLLAGAAHADDLPPPFLLAGAVEYQSIVGSVIDLLSGTKPAASEQRQAGRSTGRRGKPPTDQPQRIVSLSLPTSPAPLVWADQVCAALPGDLVPLLRDAIQASRLRWGRGFARVLLDGPLICGFGACGACAVETRQGLRMLCSDGPVFDLRDVR